MLLEAIIAPLTAKKEVTKKSQLNCPRQGNRVAEARDSRDRRLNTDRQRRRHRLAS